MTARTFRERMRNLGAGRLGSYETRLIVLLTLMFGVVFFDRNAMAYLAPFVAKSLDLNNTEIGLLSSALSLTWAISAYAGGFLSDRTGQRKRYLLIAILTFSLCSVFSGLAVSFFILLATRFLMGLSEGPIMPICQSLVVAESPPERRGLNMGVTQNFGSSLFGSFLAPLVLVAVAEAFNWRVAFFVAAVPGLIAAFFIWKMVREPGLPTPASDVEGERAAKQGESVGLLHMLGYRNVALCLFISTAMVSWMVLGWTFLPLFYLNGRGYSPGEMSILMSVLGVSAMVSAFIVPGLSDRFGRKPVMVLFALLAVLVPLAAYYYQGPLLGLCLLVFVGWSASGIFPLYMATIPAETLPAGNVATATGLVVGFGEILGGVGSPIVAGWAADLHGPAAPLVIQGALALGATALALGLKETAPAALRARLAKTTTAPAE
jgi:MFS family permease